MLQVKVLIPYLNITLSLEVEKSSQFNQLKNLVECAVKEDTPLEIYRLFIGIFWKDFNINPP